MSFFKAGTILKKQKLVPIHKDLQGPTPMTSLGGSSYYMADSKGRHGFISENINLMIIS